jgi:hypothetical protein
MLPSFPPTTLIGRARRLGAALLLALGALAGLTTAATTDARAQVPNGILIDGNAVVTGFSGTQPPLPFPPSLNDQATIDLNGPSTRIVDLQAPGAPPQAQLWNAPKPFTVLANQIGQVFAVALDNASPPNIYVAATSSYGLPIVVPGPGGTLLRAKQGSPSASFMPGLFGPSAQGGGPGSIWRIDGVTGAVTLFANVTLNGVANSGPALGGLAFDPGSSTLFAADRETGMIHRFDLSGRELGRYDHGTQGRPAAGLMPVAYDPATRLDITNPLFSTENPATWGYAPTERQIFGLAVRSGRLYYAATDGLQIWSVAISPDGTFGANPRVEIQVTPWDGGSEISKITFDNPGRMYLAERPAPTGAYDFAALAKPGVGRVLRYRGAAPPAGGPATWLPDPNEYAIGFPDQLRNDNGGIAIGYGYSPPDWRIDRGACGSFLWSTGEQLRKANDPALMTRLAASGPAIVNGLQGNSIDLVRPANVPPMQSYFVDYDDMFADDTARGHMGDIAIWRTCGQALAPLPIPVVIPIGGGGGGFCLGGDIRLIDGRCCDRRFVRDGRCFPPPCPRGDIVLPNGQCCNPREVRDGRCGCPPEEIRLPNGQCCNPREVRDGRCGGCPPEMRQPNGQCCDPRELRDGRCGGCPPEMRQPNGQCCDPREVRDGRCGGGCPPDMRQPNGQCCLRKDMRDGRCMPPTNNCPNGQIMLPGGCCPRDQVRDGRCAPPINTCPNGQIMLPGGCCPRDQVKDGRCGSAPVPSDIERKITPLRHPKVYVPQEPTRHTTTTTFHTHIPSGVIVRTPTNEGTTRGTPRKPITTNGNNVPR